MKKSFYIVFVSRDADGSLKKVPVPLKFAYIFVAAAVVGMFTVAGMAGSYSRMLIKTARFNQMRQEQTDLRKDYAKLEKVAHEKDVQAASLGALASEVSALYGLTVNKLTAPSRHASSTKQSAGTAAASAEITPTESNESFNEASYAKSLDEFYKLRASALSGSAARTIAGNSISSTALGSFNPLGDLSISVGAPSLWPVMGPITSSFGQREDPVLGSGEGEFHKGVDISAPKGTPIHATADGTVEMVGMGNGYGREVVIDHGNGVKTVYAHMSGFAVMRGAHVSRGQVIGYVGMTGRSTGYHCHYEVRIRGTAVNPHKYLRTTMASLDDSSAHS